MSAQWRVAAGLWGLLCFLVVVGFSPFKITRGPAPMLVALGAGNKRLDLPWKDPGLLP